MSYQHGRAPTSGTALAKGRDALQQELDALARVLATAAAERERIERGLEASRARQRRKRVRRGPATYQPTMQALTYRAANPDTAPLPEPVHGGRAGLQAAVREAEEWAARKTARKRAA